MTVDVRSDYVYMLIRDLWTRNTLLDQLNFYKMARKSPAAGSLAGNIFEFMAHRELSESSGMTYKIRKLDISLVFQVCRVFIETGITPV